MPDIGQAFPDARKVPTVLVLLAAFNGARWIREQIFSILSQERVDLRLVVRDDASSDSTAELVAEMAAADSRVTLIRGPTPSGSASANFFRLFNSQDTRGFEFVALSDQDDVWHLDKLDRAVRQLAAGNTVGYSGATTAFWPSGRTRVLRQNPAITESDFLFEGAGQGCTFVMTAQFFQRAQAFLTAHESLLRTIHFHDWALYALARSWGLTWIFDPTPSIRYRQHAGNDTGARRSAGGMRMRLARIRNGWYSGQLREIGAACHAANARQAVVLEWRAILESKPSYRRRLRLAAFLLRGGRRRTSDTLVLLVCAALGWI